MEVYPREKGKGVLGQGREKNKREGVSWGCGGVGVLGFGREVAKMMGSGWCFCGVCGDGTQLIDI